MPFDDESHAMRHALDALGGSLYALPDGEIGEKTPSYPNGNRAAWVMTAIDLCTADTENWAVQRAAVRNAEGFPTDYQTVQKLRAKHPPSAMPTRLNLHYHDFFRQSYPIFQRLRDERGLAGLKFQVGVPTGLGITFSMMSPLDALRYADAFNKRLAFEVNDIVAQAGDDVVIQIEVPGELAFAYMLPKFLVGITINSILGLVTKITPSARLGVHICLGDLNNKALVHAKTLDKMVHFSNALVASWPAKHRLDYIHYPLAEADTPPPLDAAFYAPLKDIKLPAGTRFVAGFIHEKRSSAEHRQLLSALEQVRGGGVDVACSCGLGRRPRPIAEALIQQMREMSDVR
jgi:hypothetical protein